MIVEGSLLFRVQLKNFLSSKYDFEIEEIHSAKGLQQYLTNVDIDNLLLIIIDIYLPDGNGLEVIQRYRKRHPYKDIPFIIVSGHINKETAALAVKAGAKDVLTKPINFDALSIRIDNFISGKYKFKNSKSAADYYRHILLEIKRARRGNFSLTLLLMGLFSSKNLQPLYKEGGYRNNRDLEQKHLKDLQNSMRETDTIVNLSPSELFFILPFADVDGIAVIYEKVKQIMNKIVDKEAQEIFLIQASVTFPLDGDDPETMISKLETNYKHNISSQTNSKENI